ncbi:MAG: competence/damage-inducible protein A [Firmicutes bacterium]|nr:competence/damage-inducible protein A [Bacillota bacterium]
MNAELIAVGTEILLGQIDNAHARYLSQELAMLGVSVYFHSSVGDNKERATQLIRTALSRSDVIILTGGLGPTVDDLTREAVADACGLPLAFSEEAFAEHVAPYFTRLGRSMPETNRRQAMRVGSAVFLGNPRGTAPGQYLFYEGKHLFLLPGPPLEMRPMFTESVRPILLGLAQAGGEVIVSRVLHLYGVGESTVDGQIADLLQAQSNPTLAPLAAEGEMLLRLTAKASSEAAAMSLVKPLEVELRHRLDAFIYGVDDDTLATVALRALSDRATTVALAESCTGGLMASMLVDIPGSSAVFVGGVVAYDNAVKVTALGVPDALLERVGAVSEEVAIAMARGVRERLHSGFGVGITGVAGPGGGTVAKPVGLVYIAVAGPEATEVRRFEYRGDRMQIRIRAAKSALHMLTQCVQER